MNRGSHCGGRQLVDAHPPAIRYTAAQHKRRSAIDVMFFELGIVPEHQSLTDFLGVFAKSLADTVANFRTSADAVFKLTPASGGLPLGGRKLTWFVRLNPSIIRSSR